MAERLLGAATAVFLVVALGVAAGADASPRAAILPTVRCPVRVGIDGLKFPQWPARQSADVPASLAARLAAYVGGLQRVVAPRGWRCNVQEAVDGSDVISVDPRKGSGSVSSWSIPACVGCMFDAVCAYFPREAKAVSVGLPCGGRPAGRRVTRLSRTLVKVRAADGSSRGLVYFEPRGKYMLAAGVTCAGEVAICEAVLADWRIHHRH